MPVNPWVELKINARFKPGGDDGIGPDEDHGAVTITDYLINAIFVLVVLRQARERELDRRSILVPLVLVFFVAQTYLLNAAHRTFRDRRGWPTSSCGAVGRGRLRAGGLMQS